MRNGKREWSHKYTEEWEKLDLYCPKCAAKDVWHETGPGDYYMEEHYMCSSCGARFYLPGGVQDGGDEQCAQRLELLRSKSD